MCYTLGPTLFTLWAKQLQPCTLQLLQANITATKGQQTTAKYWEIIKQMLTYL